MGLAEKAAELAEMVKLTKEYAELKQAKHNIDSNPGLKNRVDEFKRKQQELYAIKNPGKDADAKITELNKLFEELSKLPEISRFLKAEQELDNLMMQVYGIIGKSIEDGL